MSYVVFLARQRSGTGVLTSWLCTHPGVIQGGEILDARAPIPNALSPGEYGFFNWGKVSGKAWASNDDLCQLFQEYLADLEARPELFLLDVKLNFLEAFGPSIRSPVKVPWILEQFATGRNPVIWLTRENLVDQWVSGLLADKNRVWHTYDLSKITHWRIQADRWALAGYMEQCKEEDRLVETALANGTAPVLRTTYEELFGRDGRPTTEVLVRIATFLGLDLRKVQSNPPLLKQTSGDIRDKVENYEEIADLVGADSWSAREDEALAAARAKLTSRLDDLLPGDAEGQAPPKVRKARVASAGQAAPRADGKNLEFDAPDDIKYASEDSRFDNVVHLFHQQWHGIRSACGALPGHKVAFRIDARFTSSEISALNQRLDKWKAAKVVFHGFSETADQLLTAVLASGREAFLVWHGNLAQLVWRPEADYFNLASERARQGCFVSCHMLKPDMAGIFPRSYGPVLVNRSPRLDGARLAAAFAGDEKVGFVAAYPDIRKNLYTNLVAACAAPILTKVLHYAELVAIPEAVRRASRITYHGHDAHLETLRTVDICLNVTLIDCHPMLDLEALAVGTPALFGPLELDALWDHPYVDLCCVRDPFSTSLIRAHIERVSQIQPIEMSGILDDYRSKLSEVSAARYAEFLRL